MLTAYLGKEDAAGSQMADYTFGKIQKEDKFLICSDGISAGLTQDEIRKVLGKAPEPATKQLWKYIKKRKIRDNCTAVILQFT